MYKSCCVVLYSSISIALLTARVFQKRSQPQQLTLCRSLHAEALEATASEGLAQGPYVVARAGFEPLTLWSKGIDSTNAPPCPTYVCMYVCMQLCMCINVCMLHVCMYVSMCNVCMWTLVCMFVCMYACLY